MNQQRQSIKVVELGRIVDASQDIQLRNHNDTICQSLKSFHDPIKITVSLPFVDLLMTEWRSVERILSQFDVNTSSMPRELYKQ